MVKKDIIFSLETCNWFREKCKLSLRFYRIHFRVPMQRSECNLYSLLLSKVLLPNAHGNAYN